MRKYACGLFCGTCYERDESDLFSLREKRREEIKGYDLIAFTISDKFIPPDL